MFKRFTLAAVATVAVAAAAPAASIAGGGVGNPNPGTPPATAPGPSTAGTWTFKNCPGGTVLVSPVFGGSVVGTASGVYQGAVLVDEGFNDTTPTCSTADYVVFGGRVVP